MIINRSKKSFFALIIMALASSGGVFSQTTVRFNEEILEKIETEAKNSSSSAVYIVKGEDVIADWTFGNEPRPVEIMSVLKSVVSFGIGHLISTGEIDSLDQPVYTFYPEWNQGLKKEITIRHLLNHTSGLQNVQNAGAEIYPSPDAIQLALAADLESEPGAKLSYNNKAVNLLSGIIEKASGQRMDQFFDQKFFGPMDIQIHQWFFDSSGKPHAMAGLELLASDLAKFGKLILNKGSWGGEKLVSPDYIEAMLDQSQPYNPRFGLLWFRQLDENETPLAYYGSGYLGQWIVVIPDHDLVAVRQISGGADYNHETDTYSEFRSLVLELVE